ncbi:MAG: transporter [Ramlibacter sp.]|nr:transporter [Ramlibacter sp.]MDB5913500.1 transporter [Ramlibacter sp.]
MPGSPATPEHPTPRRIGYFLIGILLGLAGGLANGLPLASIQQLQGAFGLTSVESGWLTAAYSMTNVCTSLLLIKFRQQFGVAMFARIFLPAFGLLSLTQLFLGSYPLELAVRAIGGVVGSGLTSFCLFYVMQALPAKARLAGMVLGVGISQLALPLARVISPLLLARGDIQNLFAFELGLSLLALAGAGLLPLPPSETVDAFEPLDLLTFVLMAPGMALLCAVLAQGRTVWWTTPWLGYALAGAIVLIAAAILVEHNRANPLLNVRWMTSLDIVRFAAVAATMRVLLSEQSFGSAGLLATLGMGNDQLVVFYTVITLATLAGLVASLLSLNPQDLLRPVVISTGLIALGAWMDSDASNLTRPAQLYISQALIAFAAIYFMGPLMMTGVFRALARGPSHIVSFSAVFGISSTLGGLGGAALLGSFQVARERMHANDLVQGILMTDPQAAGRISALSGAYGRVLADPALRQAEGTLLLGQQVTREANILAFNDVFLTIATLAAIAFVVIGARWLSYRIRGINPLAGDLAALQKMREAKSNG